MVILLAILETGGGFVGDNVKVTLDIIEGACEQERNAE
jgi:hypothetical protein